jgi:predicted outer membrane repeat protein
MNMLRNRASLFALFAVALCAPRAVSIEVRSAAPCHSISSSCISEDLQVYVAIDGNDASDGLTVNNPKRSLQAALDVESSSDVTVHVAIGTYSGAANSRLYPGTRVRRIVGTSGSDKTILDLGGQGPFVTLIDHSDSFVLQGVTIRGGVADNGGAFFVRSSHLSLIDCNLLGNKARSSGGAVYASNSTVEVIGSNLVSNSAAEFGGAIFLISSRITIASQDTGGAAAILSDNKANDDGGAIFAQERSEVQIRHAVLRRNHAKDGGAIVAILGCKLVLAHIEFDANKELADGGALLLNQTKLQGSKLTFSSNAAGQGLNETAGAIFMFGGSESSLNEVHFKNNSAGGGGVLVIDGASKMEIKRVTFEHSHSTFAAVALISGSSTLIMTDAYTHSNHAQGDAGAFLVQDRSELSVENATFHSNSAGDSAGAVMLSSQAQLKLLGCTFEDNSAQVGGGALFLQAQSSLVADGVRFLRNQANRGGAILIIGASTMRTANAKFFMNAATMDGGAVFVSQASVLEIVASELNHSKAGGSGGAISLGHSTLTLETVVMRDNIAGLDGGAICAVNNSHVDATGLDVLANQVERSGGAMAIFESVLSVKSSVCSENAANKFGGAVLSRSSRITLSGLTMNSNRAVKSGGALSADQSSHADLHRIAAFDNSAGKFGGFLHADGSVVTVTESRADSNRAVNDGGGIFLLNSRFAAEKMKLTNNSARSGGGLRLTGVGSISLHESEIVLNSAASDGGGLCIDQGAVISKQKGHYLTPGMGHEHQVQVLVHNITETRFDGNYGGSGAAIHATDASIRASRLQVSNNTASGAGGGVCLISSRLHITNHSVLHGNRAGDAGGAIYGTNSACHIHMQDSRVTNNEAKADGGAGFFTDGAHVHLDKVNASNNKAAGDGGAFFAQKECKLNFIDTVVSENTGTDGGSICIFRWRRPRRPPSSV